MNLVSTIIIRDIFALQMVRNQPWLPYYPRLDALYQRWTKTSKMLKEVVVTTHEGWIRSLSSDYGEKLRQPVVKWKLDDVQALEINFNK